MRLVNAPGRHPLRHELHFAPAFAVSLQRNAGPPLRTAAPPLVAVGGLPSGLKLIGLALACVAAVLLVLAPEQNVAPIVRRSPKAGDIRNRVECEPFST